MIKLFLLSTLTALALSQQIVSLVSNEVLVKSEQNDLIEAFNSSSFQNLTTADITFRWGLSYVTASKIKIFYGSPYDDSKQTVVADSTTNSLIYSGGTSVMNFSFDFYYYVPLGTSVSGNGTGQIFASNIILRKDKWISEGKLQNSVGSLRFGIDKVTFTLNKDSPDAVDGLSRVFAEDIIKDQMMNDIGGTVSAYLKWVYYTQFTSEKSIYSKDFNKTKVDFDISLTAYKINADSLVEVRNFGVVGNTFDRNVVSTSDINTTRWGKSQIIFARSFFNETFLYGLTKNLWNTTISDSWKTNNFQFYAGDLDFVTPTVSDSYSPDEKINVQCDLTSDPSIFKWINGTNGTINFILPFACNLFVSRNLDLITTFNLSTNLTLHPIIKDGSLQLRVVTASIPGDQIFYIPNTKYPISRHDIANYFLTSGVKAFVGTELSIDFPTDISKKNFERASFEVTNDFVVLYENK